MGTFFSGSSSNQGISNAPTLQISSKNTEEKGSKFEENQIKISRHKSTSNLGQTSGHSSKNSGNSGKTRRQKD